jgi:hypothetical protein
LRTAGGAAAMLLSYALTENRALIPRS